MAWKNISSLTSIISSALLIASTFYVLALVDALVKNT